MILTPENYYSREADNHYMSVSQYHTFIGTPIRPGCPGRAIAKLEGKWKDDASNAMLIGSYVDAYFEGTLEEFKSNNPLIFTQKGELKADFKMAEDLIAFAQKDPFFMQYLVGEGRAQIILTGEIEGYPWKGKLDRLHEHVAIVDGKVVASIRDKIWDDFSRTKINFIDAYGYVEQGAVYQELYRQNSGETLPFYIAALSKEKVPDKEVIFIPDSTLRLKLDEIKGNMERILDAKLKRYPAEHCRSCDYCRSIKMLDHTIFHSDLDA